MSILSSIFFGEAEEVDLGYLKVAVTVDNQVLQSGDTISGVVQLMLLEQDSEEPISIDVGLSLHGVCYFDAKRISGSEFPDYLQPIAENKFDLFCTPVVQLASPLKLPLKEICDYAFEVGLPNALPCSFIGRFVKFVYFVTVHIETEKKTTLCRQQFDVVPRETIATQPLLVPLNLREHRFSHRDRPLSTRGDFVPDLQLQNETSMKFSQGFRVLIDKEELGVLRVSHTYIERGEVFLGLFSFSKSTSDLFCTKVIAELRHTEQVAFNDSLRNTKVYCSQHKYVANTNKMHLEWQIPLFVPLSFDTNLVTSNWHLVFEFHRQSRKTMESSIFRWELPIFIIQHQSSTRKVRRTKSVKLKLQ